MRLAVISDIHGNLEAFKAVISRLKRERYDKIVFLGDVVGYGADPNECCKLLRKLTNIVVLGNHDAAVLNPELDQYFNMYARSAIEWTRRHLSRENREWLSEFPIKVKMDDLLIVHAAPYKPEEWEYVISTYDAMFQFKHFGDKFCLFGHSHVPGAFELRDDRVEFIYKDVIELRKDARYMLNPGSIGQPRDHDPRASFAILDTDEMIFKIIRVEYDVEKASKKIINAGLPKFLADRLFDGI
ncbi:MAG: metallophosphoesterase [Candidatus Hydrothermota bacterium]|nr:MAG: metallophosphoesterase [Candidatus Hydrothermae bacterium]